MRTRTIFLGFVISVSLLGGDAFAQSIAEVRARARTKVYASPRDEDLTVAARVFDELLGGAGAESVIDPLTALALEVVVVEVRGEPITVVAEVGGARRGWGIYAFRRRTVPSVLLQAPHSFADLYTGEILEHLFMEQGVKAAAWNTAPRRSGARERVAGADDGGADLAHVDQSLFQVFTAVFVRKYPNARVVQLHGFNGKARATAEGARSDAILSNGERRSKTWLWSIERCLERNVCSVASVFPDEIAELGALTNRQGRLLRKAGCDGFLHVEMNLPLRKKLRADEDLRRKLWSCLLEGLR